MAGTLLCELEVTGEGRLAEGGGVLAGHSDSMSTPNRPSFSEEQHKPCGFAMAGQGMRLKGGDGGGMKLSRRCFNSSRLLN